MRTVVLTPWRTDNWEREAIWRAVGPHIETFGYDTYQADSGDDPFSIARSYNLASEQAGDWDLAVLHGADVWMPADAIQRAVEHAAETGKYTYAWDELIALSGLAVGWFLDGHRTFEMGEHVRPGWVPPGGPRVIPRTLWDEIGGFDPRFLGHGFEDSTFRHMARVMGGEEERLSGLAYLLHHEFDGQRTNFYSRKKYNHDLYRSIAKLTTPEELRAYIAER